MFRSAHLGRGVPRLDKPKDLRELGPVVDFETEEGPGADAQSSIEQPRFSFKASRSEFKSSHSIAGKQLPHRNFLHSHKPHWPKGPGQAKVPGLIAKFMESRLPEAQLAASPALEAVLATATRNLRRAAD